MKILLIRLRLIGDVVFTTPLLGALKRTYPEAHLAYLVERAGRAGGDGQPAPRRADRGRAEPRAGARSVDDVRLATRAAARRGSTSSSICTAVRAARWLTLATGAPQRIGYDITGAALDLHATVPPAARPAAAALGA